MKLQCLAVVGAAVTALAASAAQAVIVYDTGAANGFYTPFNSSTVAGKKFSDMGYLSGGGAAPINIAEVQLGLATFSNTPQPAGTADLVFTFNDGDPSGLQFGPGTQFFSTVIPNVELPATDGITASYFDIVIPVGNVLTTGNFNNVGWSIGVQNFNFGGSFGFQNKTAFNNVGFMTANASEYDPATNSWTAFSFGPAFPGGSANFVATMYTPEPASLTAMASLGLLISRRRR